MPDPVPPDEPAELPEPLPPIVLDPPCPASEPPPVSELLPISERLSEVRRPDIESSGTGVPIAESLVPLRVEFESDPIVPDAVFEPVPLPIDPGILPPLAPPALLFIPPVCA
jgi:hypothetical protein